MLRSARFLLLIILVAGTGCAGPSRTEALRTAPEEPPPPLLLISIDGFRWDYFERYEAPTLSRLAAEGVRSTGLIPSFPSKTFPNHYTLVTGLYPEHHGIVANNMYDPDFDAEFGLGLSDAVGDGRWWGGEPLWATAQRQGLRSATLFWPGSEAEIGGVRPTLWQPYDGAMTGAARVDTVLSWLDLPPMERPTFLTLYFSEVDHAGHVAGPVSDSVAVAVRQVDSYLRRLVEGLEARGLLGRMHLLLVSDHGMSATSRERAILLDDYLDLDRVRVVDWNPVVMIRPEGENPDSVVAALRRAPHLTVYRRDALPARWHFQAHRRIPEVIGVAEEGWSITSRSRFESRPGWLDGGTHGYDPDLRSMHGLFIAHGPAFREGVVVGPFQNVHLYNLMASLLGLTPTPNDGDLTVVGHVLRPSVTIH